MLSGHGQLYMADKVEPLGSEPFIDFQIVAQYAIVQGGGCSGSLISL